MKFFVVGCMVPDGYFGGFIAAVVIVQADTLDEALAKARAAGKEKPNAYYPLNGEEMEVIK